MRALLPHPILSFMLLLIWLLLVNTLSAGHVLLGALLGWAIPLYTASFWPEQVKIRRPLVLLRFLAVVIYDILIANVSVARLVLGSPQNLKPSFIEIPLALQSELGISLLANTVSLTPGTVSTFVSEDRSRLIVHALHTTDAEEVIATIRARYEAPLKEVFEAC